MTPAESEALAVADSTDVDTADSDISDSRMAEFEIASSVVESSVAPAEIPSADKILTPDEILAPDEVVSEDEARFSGFWTRSHRRAAAMSVWAVAFAIGWLTIGIPTDPVEACVWIWAATIAWNIYKPARTHLMFVRDWALPLLLLVAYNISRGWATTTKPHVTEVIHADEKMWGWLTGGQVPTVWLQEHLFNPVHVQWFEVVVSFVYFSHFILALLVAGVLWMRNRDRFQVFVRRWFTLTALILATYFIYPAAPPWWAAQNGYLPDVARISTRGWDALGLHHAGSLLSAAQVQEANPVAAMPSMHTAYALMVVLFFLPTVRKRWWPLMLCYPLAMAFSLMYSGEHYAIDVIMGYTYTIVTFIAVWAGERLWAARRARHAVAAAAPVSPATVGEHERFADRTPAAV